MELWSEAAEPRPRRAEARAWRHRPETADKKVGLAVAIHKAGHIAIEAITDATGEIAAAQILDHLALAFAAIKFAAAECRFAAPVPTAAIAEFLTHFTRGAIIIEALGGADIRAVPHMTRLLDGMGGFGGGWNRDHPDRKRQ